MFVRFVVLRKFLATRENTSTIEANATMMPLCRRLRVNRVRSFARTRDGGEEPRDGGEESTKGGQHSPDAPLLLRVESLLPGREPAPDPGAGSRPAEAGAHPGSAGRPWWTPRPRRAVPRPRRASSRSFGPC